MKYLFFGIIAILLTYFHTQQFQFLLHKRETASIDSLQVMGSDDFIQNINKAVDELKSIDPFYFTIIKNNLGIIQEYTVSAIHVEESPPRLELSNVSCSSSNIKWCASVLYHEAWHVWLFKNQIPFVGEKAENFCNLKQLMVLNALKADPETINHLQNIISQGDHSDLDNDGDYDQDDYNLRDW